MAVDIGRNRMGVKIMVIRNTEEAILMYCDADLRVRLCELLKEHTLNKVLCPTIEQAMEYARQTGLLV